MAARAKAESSSFCIHEFVFPLHSLKINCSIDFFEFSLQVFAFLLLGPKQQEMKQMYSDKARMFPEQGFFSVFLCPHSGKTP